MLKHVREKHPEARLSSGALDLPEEKTEIDVKTDNRAQQTIEYTDHIGQVYYTIQFLWLMRVFWHKVKNHFNFLS